MYKYFYLTMLIGAILLGIITLATSNGKRTRKTWRYIMRGLVVTIIVAIVGFITTVG